MPLDIDWTSIRPLSGSKHASFEELCTQLARAGRPARSTFHRKGRPDSGVEAYAVMPDTTESAWQAKYFHTINESQWSQLDESVKAALDGHPMLRCYTVCVPLDLPDGRLGRGKSAQQRWLDRVVSWKQWASDKGMDVDFVWQGSHELLAELSKPGNEGLTKFFFGNRYLDDAWLQSRLAEAHESAGPRYTAELSIKLSISERLQAFGRTPAFFDRIRSVASDIRERVGGNALHVANGSNASLESLLIEARLACNQALNEFKVLSDDPTIENPLSPLHNSLRKAIDSTSHLLLEFRRRRETAKAEAPTATNRPHSRQEDDPATYGLRHLRSSLEDAHTLVNEFMEVAHSRLLILSGEAGTGKTHLLCDHAGQRLRSGLPTVVLMGQRFLTESDPWTQALQQLDLSGWNSQELVAALEVVAQRAEKRLLFIVDAINEGAGTRLWPEHLSPFLERIARSNWIGVVLSVRSSYLESVIPATVQERATQVQHYGFDNVEFDATRAFFEYYGIDLPSTPLLAPEFRNPLYLKTLCIGLTASAQKRLPRGFHGVVSAFGMYLTGVNTRLAKELDFNGRQNLAKKALESLARRMVATRQFWLSYPDAEAIVDALLPGREYSRSLMPRLLAAGLLIEENPWHEAATDSVVVIAYERLSDYLCVGVLLEDTLSVTELESAFAAGGPLDLNALSTVWSRPGFHEALHTLVAERTGRELLDLLPTLATHHYTTTALLNSIVWRDPAAVNERAVQFLLQLKLTENEKVVETLITLATIPDHPLNANFLDQELRKSCMADRDAWWSAGLHALWESQSSVDRLVHWSNRLWPHSAIDDKAAELTATVITWLLTSSNRYLRDHASKSLVRVLTWRPALIADLVRRFSGLDDAYVAERVLAAAYGASMRTVDAKGIELVANAAHMAVFSGGRPRPHLLLREYARGIIKRADYLRAPSRSPWAGVDPPYTSDWPNIPDQAAIDSLVPSWGSGGDRSSSWGKNRILNSVMDDDFGRYIIGTNSWSTSWLSLRLNEPQWLSLERRIEEAVAKLSEDERLGWDVFEEIRRRSSIDRLFSSIRYTSQEGSNETASSHPDYEPLLKIKDLFLEMLGPDRAAEFSPLMDQIISGDRVHQAPLFDLKQVQRYVVSRVFDLGWTPERFEEFDSEIQSSGRGEAKAERMGKKYQWIAYYEMLAFMADHFQYAGGTNTKEIGTAYQGSWQENFRDIDPSNVTHPLPGSDEGSEEMAAFWSGDEVKEWGVTATPNAWAQSTDEIPLPGDLLLCTDNPSQSDWVNLYAEFKWSMPRPAYEASYKDGRREIWMNVEGALVKRSDVAKLRSKKVAKRIAQNYNNNNDNHSIYLGEVGWSEASRHFLDPYYGNRGWSQDAEREGISAMPASQGYMRERGTIDCSLTSESLKLRMPSADMLESLGAIWSGVSATYVDKANPSTVLAFDPSVNVRGPAAFLVRRGHLVDVMRNHDLVVCWAVHGEKMDAEGAPDYRPIARRSFHGLFFWSGEQVDGQYTFEDPEISTRNN